MTFSLPVPEASDQTQHCQLSPVYTSKADVLAPLAVVPDFSGIYETKKKAMDKSFIRNNKFLILSWKIAALKCQSDLAVLRGLGQSET